MTKKQDNIDELYYIGIICCSFLCITYISFNYYIYNFEESSHFC